jgi:hypothetical protein
VCRKKISDQSNPVTVSLLTAPEIPAPRIAAEGKEPKPTPTAEEFVFTVSTGSGLPQWVLDSGATCCATFTAADCVVRACQVNVTAAGSTFEVTQIGTAVLDALDESGRSVKLSMQNTLISPKFPYKLLALQLFTRKGHEITMDNSRMRIVNKKNDHV